MEIPLNSLKLQGALPDNMNIMQYIPEGEFGYAGQGKE
jgi:hypothetical protein